MSGALLEATGVVHGHRVDRPVLRGIDLRVAAGETLGLIGGSGSGKSTLARILLGLQRPDAGTVRFGDVDLYRGDRAALRAVRPRLQAVFQDPHGSLDPRWRVGRIVAEPLLALGGRGRSDRAARERRVREALEAVSLPPDAAKRYPHAFSGGQLQRIAIARAMVRAGDLAPQRAGADAIRGWLAAHAGAQAQAVMDLDLRYVFFRLAPDDGRDPAGAAGVPLPPGRALAVDPSRHGYGELYWNDASAPVLAGAARSYRRLALALDTGSAIRGDIRADLYTGRGEAAGAEAGRVRHTLRLVRLVPVAAPGS